MSQLIFGKAYGPQKFYNWGTQGSAVAFGDISDSNMAGTANGSFKPLNAATKETFKELQRQINRVAHATKKFDKIGVDGIIGKNTLGAFNLAQKSLPFSIVGTRPFTTTKALANKADVMAAAVKRAADSLGAPVKVGGSINPARSGGSDKSIEVDPSGVVMATKTDPLSFVKGPVGLAALGIGATVLYLKTRKGGKKRRKR